MHWQNIFEFSRRRLTMFTNPLKRVIVLTFLQSAKFFRTTSLPVFHHLAGRVKPLYTLQKSRSYMCCGSVSHLSGSCGSGSVSGTLLPKAQTLKKCSNSLIFHTFWLVNSLSLCCGSGSSLLL